MLLRAALCQSLGDTEDVHDLCTRALGHDPCHVQARLMRARNPIRSTTQQEMLHDYDVVLAGELSVEARESIARERGAVHRMFRDSAGLMRFLNHTSSQRSPYEVLGLDTTSTREHITSKYHTLCRLYHTGE